MKQILKATLIFPLLCIMLIFAGCFGCPYSFTGASVPEHLKTVAIPFAEDRSGFGEPGLRENFTQTLIQKFIEDNNLQISDRANADAIIDCTITSINDAPAAVLSGENVATRRLSVSVQVSYKDLVKKKTIYDRQFSNYGDYAANSGVAGRNDALTNAIDKLTDDILLETVSGW